MEVLRAFTLLGLTSFGGPVAHLAYFRREFVERRRWVDERSYADLVALCQFLPGPASSKLGFSLGLLRAGLPGGLAAWAGFTIPSAVLMVCFALGVGHLPPYFAGLLHGLQLVAVAIVAQAVCAMWRTLCPDLRRAAIALAAAALATTLRGGAGQMLAIAAGAALGLWWCRGAGETVPAALEVPLGRGAATACATAFAVILGWSLTGGRSAVPAVFAAFYRAGALVFGGGHVVLPLLDEAIVAPGWVDTQTFLAGYGAAQALPGPLFTFAAYLGASMRQPIGGIAGAALALVAIFLPGLLLQLASLPFWTVLRGSRSMQSLLRGINAAVVGLLAAALWRPVGTGAVHGVSDALVALAAFLALTRGRIAPVVVVAAAALTGLALAQVH
jgi:chromate transporter